MRRLLAAALLLALAAPAWLLAGAAWNRFGEPLAELALDSRELAPGHGGADTPARVLRLRWQGDADELLDAGRLQSLGFDLTPPRHGRRVQQRSAFALLELDPGRWQSELDQARAGLASTADPPASVSAAAEGKRRQPPVSDADPGATDGSGADIDPERSVPDARAHRQVQQARQASRLYMREVAGDAGSLRALCPDPDRCLVIPVQVSLSLSRSMKSGAPTSGTDPVRGHFIAGSRPSLHVPARWQATLAEALRARSSSGPAGPSPFTDRGSPAGDDGAAAPHGRWQAQVRQGRRLELWLARVTVTGSSP